MRGRSSGRSRRWLTDSSLARLGELAKRLDDATLKLPEDTSSKAALKRWEDTLDALVCARVGVEYVEGRATVYGDGTAAIWCPT